jgi:undecaprenyl-diphosphatase
LTWFDALLLGIVQGITEFLPISSDGHLVVVQHILGYSESLLVFDVFVHAGTLLAILVFFRRPVYQHTVGVFKADGDKSRKLLLYIIIASIPAGIVGLTLEDSIEKLFASATATGYFWILNGLVLLIIPKLRIGNKDYSEISWRDALLIGMAQSTAILPGVSRSGTTISTGMARGMEPVHAANFSFLMAIPAILGAILLQVDDALLIDSHELKIYAFGALMAAIVGFGAIYLLLKLLARRKIQPFGWYCILAGLITVGYSWIK